MSRVRVAAGAALLLIAAVACGGQADTPPPVEPDLQGRALALPQPTRSVALFRIELPRGVRPGDLRSLRRLPRINVAAAVALERVRVAGPNGAMRLRVAAVDAVDYRPLAPAATKQAEFVWSALLAGKAVATFDVAARSGIEGATEVTIGTRRVAVGAVAELAVPSFADVVVSDHLAPALRLRQARTIFVGARTAAAAGEVRDRLRRALPDARLQRLVPEERGRPPDAIGHTEGGVIPGMTFRIKRNGYIEPDPAWVASNIATAEVPILGTVTCHRLMFPQLRAALAEIEQRKLDRFIRTDDFGGCYAPRFIGRDPRRGLSMHAFGLAVDLNVSTNHYGTRGDLDPRIAQAFERWGFEWGGRWSPPDPMHFELTRLIQT